MVTKTIQEYFGLREELGRGGFGIVYATESPYRVAKLMKIKLLGCEGRSIDSECTYVGQTGRFSQFEVSRRIGDETFAEIVDFFPSELVRLQMITQEIGILQDAKKYSVMDGGRLVGYCSHTLFVDDEGWLSVLVGMDRVQGDPLSHLRVPYGKSQKVEFCSELADAVDAFHSLGFMHLDIKPGNIMLGAEGIVLIDYTAALSLESRVIRNIDQLRLGEANCLPDDGTFRGTVEYVAPEQARGCPTLKSDYYALGLVTLELLDRYPFARLESRDGLEVEKFIRANVLETSNVERIVQALAWSPFMQMLPKESRNLFAYSIREVLHCEPEKRKTDNLLRFCKEYNILSNRLSITKNRAELPTIDVPNVSAVDLPERVDAGLN